MVAHFEYDSKKSEANFERHGIDFIDAQELWATTHVVIPAKDVAGEPLRHLREDDGKSLCGYFYEKERGNPFDQLSSGRRKMGENP